MKEMKEMHMREHHDEQGFVLVTTLVIVMILMIMGISLFYKNRVNQQSSVSARDSSKAYYLAEAGLNYIAYALNSTQANTTQTASGLNLDQDKMNDPDNAQLLANPDQNAPNNASYPVLGYLDLKNTVDYNPMNSPHTPNPIILSTISTWAPPHVELDITTDANNIPSVLPNWGTSGNLYPTGDGAIVWLVPAVYNQYNPLGEYDTSNTSQSYSIYAYSIGYVNGRPLRMLRAKVCTLIFGFPSTLGATTNAYVPGQ